MMSLKDTIQSYPVPPVFNEESLKMEQMYGLDMYQIIKDTKQFDHSQIQNESSRLILMKLIYILNQGNQFSEQELELVFFRVTKLLLANNSKLLRLVYKTLKILGVQNYGHIILQTLIKNLMSSNQLIRVEALRLISMISEEQHIFQIESYLINAIQDKNIYISSTAIIVGIKIVNKFPHIVKRWQPFLESNQFQQMNYHALVLLYEINKNDRRAFIPYLKCCHSPQLDLVNLQLLQFIRELSLKSDLQKEIFNLEVMQFLEQSIKDGQKIIFLEAYLVIIQNNIQEKFNLNLIYLQFKRIFKDYNCIEIYRAVKILCQAIQTFPQSEIVTLKYFLEMGTCLNYHSVSCRSILYCIKLRNQDNKLDTYFQSLFNYTIHEICQYNFLEGLSELVLLYPEYAQPAFDSLQLTVFKDSNINIKNIAMKVICFSLSQLQNSRHRVLKMLFELPQPNEIPIQFFSIMLTCHLCFRFIKPLSLDYLNTQISFEYLKKQFENGSDAFYNNFSLETKQIKQHLLQIVENNKQDINQETSINNSNIYSNIYSNIDYLNENNSVNLMENDQGDFTQMISQAQREKHSEYNKFENQ